MPILNTADLTGEALNWATGSAASLPLQIVPAQYGVPARVFLETPCGLVRYRPAVDWLQAGELLDRLDIDLTGDVSTEQHQRGNFRLAIATNHEILPIMVTGPDNRTAICRAVALAFFGEMLLVPEALA